MCKNSTVFYQPLGLASPYLEELLLVALEFPSLEFTKLEQEVRVPGMDILTAQ